MSPHTATFRTPSSPSNPDSLRLPWQHATLRQIKKLGQAIATYLSQRNEPKIVQRVHRDGHISWIVYDHCSNQPVICSSEAEVRFWLEQRYNAH